MTNSDGPETDNILHTAEYIFEAVMAGTFLYLFCTNHNMTKASRQGGFDIILFQSAIVF